MTGLRPPITLPALTIWQPWASLIMAGAKPFEFRGWPAPRALRGKRIAIHAGARRVAISEMAELRVRLAGPDHWSTGLVRDIALPLLERWSLSPALLPLGSILGTALLGEPIRGADLMGRLGVPVNDSDRHEHGNWGWPLSGIRPLTPVLPARGGQGFWPCSVPQEVTHG